MVNSAFLPQATGFYVFLSILWIYKGGAHLEISKGSSESWLLWLLSVRPPASQGQSQPSCDFCLLELCSEIVTFPFQNNVTSNRLPPHPCIFCHVF